jgi:hypothetical protein
MLEECQLQVVGTFQLGARKAYTHYLFEFMKTDIAIVRKPFTQKILILKQGGK